MGAALGKERSFAKHSAGVRTMSLVALGACAFTICSMYGFAGTRCDTARIAANVASGVGFIGAGVITTSTRNSHNLVHGLTTAATIWNAAAVGMACGVGLLRIATTSALVTLGILRLGRRKPKHQAQQQQQEQRETWASSQESHHPLIPRPQQSDQQVVEDEEDDQDAEVHDTSDWDENPHADEAEEQLAEIRSVSLNSDKFANQDDSSSLMEAVVRSAWRNSTDYLDTLIPTERTERQRRSSSNKDYGP
jgi:putative Mg2+ transporter-C (MgtC) family protein